MHPACGAASIWVWFESEAATCQSPRQVTTANTHTTTQAPCECETERQRGPVVLCLDEVIGPHPEPSITGQRRMKINPNIEAESRATKWLDRDRQGGDGLLTQLCKHIHLHF